jgi:hypothetical protein
LTAAHRAALEDDALALRAEVEALAFVRLAALLRAPCGSRAGCAGGAAARCGHREAAYVALAFKARRALRRAGGLAAVRATDAAGAALDAFSPRGAAQPWVGVARRARPLGTWTQWKARWTAGYSLIDAAGSGFPPHMSEAVLIALRGVAEAQTVAGAGGAGAAPLASPPRSATDPAPATPGAAADGAGVSGGGGGGGIAGASPGASAPSSDRLFAIIASALAAPRSPKSKEPKLQRDTARAQRTRAQESARAYLRARLAWLTRVHAAASATVDGAFRGAVRAALAPVGAAPGVLADAAAAGDAGAACARAALLKSAAAAGADPAEGAASSAAAAAATARATFTAAGASRTAWALLDWALPPRLTVSNSRALAVAVETASLRGVDADDKARADAVAGAVARVRAAPPMALGGGGGRERGGGGGGALPLTTEAALIRDARQRPLLSSWPTSLEIDCGADADDDLFGSWGGRGEGSAGGAGGGAAGGAGGGAAGGAGKRYRLLVLTGERTKVDVGAAGAVGGGDAYKSALVTQAGARNAGGDAGAQLARSAAPPPAPPPPPHIPLPLESTPFARGGAAPRSLAAASAPPPPAAARDVSLLSCIAAARRTALTAGAALDGLPSHAASAIAREARSALEYVVARVDAAAAAPAGARAPAAPPPASPPSLWGARRGGGAIGIWGDAAPGENTGVSAHSFAPAAPKAPKGPKAPKVGAARALLGSKKAAGGGGGGGASSVTIIGGGGARAGARAGAASAPPAGASAILLIDDAALERAGEVVRAHFERFRAARGPAGAVDVAAAAAQLIIAARPRAARRKKDDGLFCSCRTPYDATRAYIACDSCENWLHLGCARVSPFAAAYTILSFACAQCSKGAANAHALVREPDDPVLADARAAVLAARAAGLVSVALAAKFVGAAALPAALRCVAVSPREAPPPPLRLRRLAAGDVHRGFVIEGDFAWKITSGWPRDGAAAAGGDAAGKKRARRTDETSFKARASV